MLPRVPLGVVVLDAALGQEDGGGAPVHGPHVHGQQHVYGQSYGKMTRALGSNHGSLATQDDLAAAQRLSEDIDNAKV